MKTMEKIANILLGISIIGWFVNTVLFIWYQEAYFGKLALIEFVSVGFIVIMYGIFIHKD
jgi:hypothetical protein